MRSMMCGVLGWLVAGSAALAQPPGVRVGERVRVHVQCVESQVLHLPCTPIAGVVELASRDSLIVRTHPTVDYRIAWHELRSVAISRGQRSMAGAGVKTGLLIGGAFGIAVMLAPCDAGCWDIGPALAAVGIVGGAAIGALIGSGMRTDIWEPVEMHVGVAPAMTRDAVGLRVTLSRR